MLLVVASFFSSVAVVVVLKVRSVSEEQRVAIVVTAVEDPEPSVVGLFG